MEKGVVELVKKGVVGDPTTMIPVYGNLVKVHGREFHLSAEFFPVTGAVSIVERDWQIIAAYLLEQGRRDPDVPSTPEVEGALKAIIVDLVESKER